MDGREILVALAMLVGLVGILVPLVPGLPLILVAALVWVVADGADATHWLAFGAIVATTVGGMVVSSVIPARRAATAGAPPWVLGVGAMGVVVGFFVIPVVGALVGGPIGIYAGEWLRLRDHRAAWQTTRATLRGIGAGIAIQMVAGVAAVAIWAVAAVAP